MLNAFKTSASVDFEDAKSLRKQSPSPTERGARTGAGLLVEFVTPLGTHLEQPVPEGLQPTGDPNWRAL